MNSSVRSFAQCPDRYTWLAPGVERSDDGRACVIQGAVWAAVSGIRVAADEVEQLVADVQELVAAEKHAVWWIDPDVEPADLVERLTALGFREPADRVARLEAVACITAPTEGPADVEVRLAETYDDFVTGMEVMWRAFETPADRVEQQRAELRADYDSARESGTPATFLAFVDGKPAGLARSLYSDVGVFLIAGAVEEWARGRGVYRSLVRARWDDAVARKTPALVCEANPDTSYPILKRLGFVDVCSMQRLEDPR